MGGDVVVAVVVVFTLRIARRHDEEQVTTPGPNISESRVLSRDFTFQVGLHL